MIYIHKNILVTTLVFFYSWVAYGFSKGDSISFKTNGKRYSARIQEIKINPSTGQEEYQVLMANTLLPVDLTKEEILSLRIHEEGESFFNKIDELKENEELGILFNGNDLKELGFKPDIINEVLGYLDKQLLKKPNAEFVTNWSMTLQRKVKILGVHSSESRGRYLYLKDTETREEFKSPPIEKF
jgi:hypothetical protein